MSQIFEVETVKFLKDFYASHPNIYLTYREKHDIKFYLRRKFEEYTRDNGGDIISCSDAFFPSVDMRKIISKFKMV